MKHIKKNKINTIKCKDLLKSSATRGNLLPQGAVPQPSLL
jgi:hypothetical protein